MQIVSVNQFTERIHEEKSILIIVSKADPAGPANGQFKYDSSPAKAIYGYDEPRPAFVFSLLAGPCPQAPISGSAHPGRRR
jgi:hypothetical protein